MARNEHDGPRGRRLQHAMDGAVGLGARGEVGGFRMLSGLLFQVLWGLPYRFIAGWWHAVRSGERRRMAQLVYGAPALAGLAAVAGAGAMATFGNADAVVARYQAAVEAALAKANNDIRSPAWAEAKLLLSRLRVLRPQNPQPSHMLADIYRREGNQPAGWMLMNLLASREDASNIGAHMSMAEAYLARPNRTPFDLKAAKGHLDKVLAAMPDDPYMNANMGKLLLEMRQLPLADEHLRRAARGNEAFKLDYAGFLGMFPERRAESVALSQGAELYHRQILDKAPKDVLARMGTARALALQGRHADAVDLLGAGPADLGEAARKALQQQQAHTLHQWGSNLPGDDPQRWAKFARAAELLQHDADFTGRMLRLALDNAPDEKSFRGWLPKLAAAQPVQASLSQALLAILRGPPDAVEPAFRAAQAKPDAVRTLRALVLAGGFQPGTVLDFVAQAERHWPNDRNVEFLRARALVIGQRYPEAKLSLERLLADQPGDPGVNGLLATVYDRLAMPHQAEQCRKIAESGLSTE